MAASLNAVEATSNNRVLSTPKSPQSDEDDDDALETLSMPLPRSRSGPIADPSKTYPAKRDSIQSTTGVDVDDAAEALLAREHAWDGEARPSRPRANTFSRFSFDFSRSMLPIPLSVETGDEREEKNFGVG